MYIYIGGIQYSWLGLEDVIHKMLTCLSNYEFLVDMSFFDICDTTKNV